MNTILLALAVVFLVSTIALAIRLNRMKRSYQELKAKYRPVLSLKDEITKRQEELELLEASIKSKQNDASELGTVTHAEHA